MTKKIIKLISCIIIIVELLLVKQAHAAPTISSYSYSEMYAYDNQDSLTEINANNPKTKIADPFYVINKHIFNINYIIDSAFLSPIAETYVRVIPEHGRARISNFMGNLGEPINFFNLIFQGKFSDAKISFARFITNSTLGCFGVMDVASKLNLLYKSEDFGQTLAKYKMPTGPYIVAPILGPTSFRDLTGKVVDFFINPFQYVMARDQRNVVNAVWLVQKRADLNEVVNTINRSLNPYETAKTLYIQNRENQIKK